MNKIKIELTAQQWVTLAVLLTHTREGLECSLEDMEPDERDYEGMLVALTEMEDVDTVVQTAMVEQFPGLNDIEKEDVVTAFEPVIPGL